mgnify:CR=1 FL=1
MDEEFLINIVIAGKKYPLTIKRHEEELARAAADQINSKILQYRQHFAVEVDTKDLLAMVAFQLSMHNLELEKRNDTNPFTDKIQELTTELEGYLKKSHTYCKKRVSALLCTVRPCDGSAFFVYK